MQLFFVPEISNEFLIDGEEAGHLIRVLRKREGEIIFVTDGKGKGCEVKIIRIGKKELTVQWVRDIANNSEINIRVHLAVAPTKNADRFEWMAEKAIELGVSEITPLICERSERKNINLDRLQKLALAAMKQSGRFYLPVINETIKWKDFSANAGLKLIAHCEEKEKSGLQELPTSNDVLILIGPEGDFTPSEIDFALKNGYQPVSLGNSRLRTETAAIHAMSFFRFRSE